MKKLLALPLLLAFCLPAFATETYTPPSYSFKAEPVVLQTAKSRDKWSKGTEYRIYEHPVIIREIASEKEKAGRNPSSYEGMKVQHIKFVAQPWYYTRD